MLTIITPYESVSIPIRYHPIHMFLRLLHRNVHVPIQALEYAYEQMLSLI